MTVVNPHRQGLKKQYTRNYDPKRQGRPRESMPDNNLMLRRDGALKMLVGPTWKDGEELIFRPVPALEIDENGYLTGRFEPYRHVPEQFEFSDFTRTYTGVSFAGVTEQASFLLFHPSRFTGEFEQDDPYTVFYNWVWAQRRAKTELSDCWILTEGESGKGAMLSSPNSALMRGFGKRAPMAESNTLKSRLNACSALPTTNGARLMLSTPPARNSSPSPQVTARAASSTAARPLEHRRFTVCPGTPSPSPDSSATWRATLRASSPAWQVQPSSTSSTPAVTRP